jgi:hypothetical protein
MVFLGYAQPPGKVRITVKRKSEALNPLPLYSPNPLEQKSSTEETSWG